MNPIRTALAIIVTVAAIIWWPKSDDKQDCNISINPDGTWTATGWNPPDCTFPTWATFHADGTWTETEHLP